MKIGARIGTGRVQPKPADPPEEARERFVCDYAAARGWDRARLTIAQIAEIQRQPGWRVPEVGR